MKPHHLAVFFSVVLLGALGMSTVFIVKNLSEENIKLRCALKGYQIANGNNVAKDTLKKKLTPY
jgi:hypothetical protein